MARIRSIKPEFWQSEVVASWDLEVRLTFIGLWSHVDDNGVGLASPHLIRSALYPFDDPHESLARVQRTLAILASGGQIVLYTARGKQLLFLTGWDDNQKIDRPSKPRWPRPDEAPTSDNTPPPPPPAPSSRDPRETLAQHSLPEQGSGIREQGAGNREWERASAPAAAPPAAALVVVGDPPINDPKLAAFDAWLTAIRSTGTVPSRRDRSRAAEAIRELIDLGNDPTAVIEAARRAGMGGWATVDRELARLNGRASPRPSPRDEKIARIVGDQQLDVVSMFPAMAQQQAALP